MYLQAFSFPPNCTPSTALNIFDLDVEEDFSDKLQHKNMM